MLNFLLPRNKKKNRIKVCLCVIGKKENLYIKEFVNHYREIGYNHIYIYDNNDINSERIDSIINNPNFVTIIDYRGYRNKKNNSQYEAYYDCYEKNNRNYDWLSFFDFDEYLEIIPNNQTIQEFLDNGIFKKCQVIKINWLFYSSAKEILAFENKPLKIRFKNKLLTPFNSSDIDILYLSLNPYLLINNELNEISNRHIKSTVRGGLIKNYWSRWENSHTSIDTFKSCSSSGKRISGKTSFVNPPDFKNAFIKHYYFKSFEEFCLKLKRGWPDSTDKIKWINNLINENKNSKSKLNIIKKILNISLI